MTPQIRIDRSTKFGLDLNTKSGNLSEVNKIDALIGLCACDAWKKVHAASAYCATGLVEVDAP